MAEQEKTAIRQVSLVMRQPAREHELETPGTQVAGQVQRDPVAQVPCREGDAGCAGEHASTLQRATDGQPARARGSLLRLQREYGNQFVRRVVTLARKGQGEADVTPEVEEAIQAARGGGQALDHTVRAQMEPAMGADFGGVRVHTGSQADALNRSLSARAFTTGQDIFFKQGEYSPGSSGGRELLAHELTHVVQQNGDQVQRKLTVGAPGDRHEQEADQVARAVLRHETVNRALGQQFPGDKDEEVQTRREVIQRRLERLSATGWGTAHLSDDSNVSFNPHVELWISGRRVRTDTDWFPNGRSTDLTLSPGSTGVIRVQVDATWFQDNMLLNASGNGLVTVDVRFTVSSQGALQMQRPDINSESRGGAAELVTPVTVDSETTRQGGYIRVSPIIRGEQSRTATANVGFEAVATGGFGGERSTTDVQSWQRTFNVNLIVPRPRTVVSTYRTDALFGVNSDRVEVGTEERIAGWFLGLPENVKQRVRNGSMPIELIGHASTTGSADHNRRLSQRRVARVREILVDLAGSQAQIHTRSLGEYEARTPNQIEEVSERRVEMSVSGEETASRTE